MMSIFTKINSWLSEKPYTKAMYISAIATVIMAGLTALMCYSLVQNRIAIKQAYESLELAKKSLEMQEREFKLRNRPLVVIGSHEFSGPAGDSTNKAFPRSIKTNLTNISEIPATNVAGSLEVIFNGVSVGVAELKPTAVTKGAVRTLALGISENTYKLAQTNENRFETITKISYSGMLGEEKGVYETIVSVYWSPNDNHFVNIESTYK